MKKLLERVQELWCETMHGDPMWPSRGYYQCRVCHRQYPVPFETMEAEAPRRQTAFAAAAVAGRRA